MTLTTQWNEAYQAVQQAQRILVVTHISPDGDAIGSMLGTANALRAIGKSVDTAVDEGVPPFLAFLPQSQHIMAELNSGQWDLMISVDASDEQRTGAVGAYGRANSTQVINLDHHATNTGFGNLHLIDPQAVSATQIVYEWFAWCGFPITYEVAVPLLTGLVTDTLGFRISGVTPRTLEIAQALMQAGASLPEITARALDTMTYNGLRLWALALNRATLENGVMYASLTRDDYVLAGTDDEAGLSGFLVRVQEAKISAVFNEQPDGKINVSMRAKKGYDVAQVALMFGGGGHKPAAGATIDGTLEQVRAQVLAALFEMVSRVELAG